MKFGNFELYVLDDGAFRLDGGAMFGVVPKTLWTRVMTHDERNRIPMTSNTLLIKTGSENILIDTGCGGKWQDKESDMFAMQTPRQLVTELLRVDLRAEDITHVIQTHLHFDHAGGGTFIDREGNLKVQFPNAKYYVQRGEWEVAQNPNLRDRRSYKPENLLPLKEEGVLELVDGDVEVLPGIRFRITGGHTKYHSIIEIESEGNKCVFLGDLIPKSAHLPIPYIMAYDLYPTETMEYKTTFLREAFEGKYLLVFEHGVENKAGRLIQDAKGRFSLEAVDMEAETYSVT